VSGGRKMRKTFVVDRVSYVVELTEKNEFFFFINVRNSGKVVYRMSSFERAFGDDPPETVWAVTGSGHVFEVKRGERMPGWGGTSILGEGGKCFADNPLSAVTIHDKDRERSPELPAELVAEVALALAPVTPAFEFGTSINRQGGISDEAEVPRSRW